MSAAVVRAEHAGSHAKVRRPWTAAETWGALMLLPYVLVFLAFVLYPVLYGFWLARHPSSYVDLFNDPIFRRSIVNTLVFLVVAINVKMLLALFLSGFFLHDRWWVRWL